MPNDRPRRLFVVQTHPGRTVMQRIRRPRIRFAPIDELGPAYHDIAVFPASDHPTYIQCFGDIPDRVWDPARQGRGKVLFDASCEGQPHQPYRSGQLHALLDRVGVAHAQAVCLTQDRGYADAYRAYCKATGEAPMKVIVHDYWIDKVIDQHMLDGVETFEARLAAYRARPRRREKTFLCLTHSLRPTKTLFLLRLMHDALWERGFISVGGLDFQRTQLGFDDAQMQKYLFGLRGFGVLSAKLRPLLPRLQAVGRVFLEAPTTGADAPAKPQRYAMDQPLTEYGRSWFSIIPETEMGDRVIRLTEKPLKPLMNFHPFIVLGNPGELGLLRQYGFQTFPGLFDESYDEELRPVRRFEMVYREVQRLCRLDEAELERLGRQVEETVIFNARRALVKLPIHYQERLDTDLVCEILAPLAEEEAASPQSHPKPALGLTAG